MPPTAEIRHGEALRVLAELDTASVDTVITDPPYSSGGMVRGDRAAGVHAKYVQTNSTSGNALAAFTGDNRDQRSFAVWSAWWLGEALRVTKPGGALVMFTDWRQLPTVTDMIQVAGWVWRGIVPWHKPNGRRTQGRFANNCEYIVWGTCGPRPLDAIPGNLEGFFQINTPRQREHVTQKPVELMREIVKITPHGGLVLDPFAGSGTTGVAAVLEGRPFLGVEASAHFHAIATRRLAETQAQLGEQLTLTP